MGLSYLNENLGVVGIKNADLFPDRESFRLSAC
jgi:hypothetical protein